MQAASPQDYGLTNLSDIGAADLGLICAFSFSPTDVRELEIDDVTQPGHGALLWLHFNLSNARARHLLSHARFIPDDLKEVFREHDMRRRIELLETGLLVVISDLAFDAASDIPEVAPLWCFLAPHLFITARTHPLKTTDQLRSAVRSGRKFGSTFELLAWILARRTATLRDIAEGMTERVGEIEDEILAGSVKQQREQLGRIRRFCARLRRHFAPDRTAFLKLLQRHPSLLEEHIELIRSEIDELSFLTDEVNELYERAKLLQEELASRVAEDTGRNLYVLAILSAVFLPMTLITGIFGMNVAGLPGVTGSSGSFWWVMLLILASGGVTLATIFSRRRF